MDLSIELMKMEHARHLAAMQIFGALGAASKGDTQQGWLTMANHSQDDAEKVEKKLMARLEQGHA